MRIDIRLFYVFRRVTDWSRCRWDPKDEDWPHFWRISTVSKQQICYSTEALRYAQSAYLVSIVACQWSCLLITKSRALSIAQQGMKNNVANFALMFETVLIAFLMYCVPINVGLGSRPVACTHFMVPVFAFTLIILLQDELKKLFIRRGIIREAKGKIKLDGWFARNTYFWTPTINSMSTTRAPALVKTTSLF